jgi:tRNA pseudouridine32 synthase / 23S rRNA pseudouridine746 synthase
MRSPHPSRAYLPKLDPPPATILDHLDERFPRVGRDVWISRMQRGLVLTASGRKLTEKSPYAHGLTVLYYRESDDEAIVPFAETIVHRDERIIIADKPHFLPVVPGGPYADECLLARVQRRTGLGSLTPIHRLDRDTAGLVLFVTQPELRAPYHRLFADEAVRKEYLAVASMSSDTDEREWRVENRLAPGEPWFRTAIVDGTPNATTEITLLERRDTRGLFRLIPRTGKKHQLRVHMASLGFPIVNDRLYPSVIPLEDGDYSRPLQLLAQRLAFRDPISGDDLVFESMLSLAW